MKRSNFFFIFFICKRLTVADLLSLWEGKRGVVFFFDVVHGALLSFFFFQLSASSFSSSSSPSFKSFLLYFIFCRLTRAGQRLNPFIPRSPLVFPSPSSCCSSCASILLPSFALSRTSFFLFSFGNQITLHCASCFLPFFKGESQF